VAESLDLHVGLVLTDNRYFPSSALGRVESLKLLWEIANDGGARLQVDRDHLDTNIILAAEALRLAYPDSNDDFKNLLRERLATKAIRNVLVSHLEAQGASLASLERILNASESREKIAVEIDSNGLWIPPDLELAKNWIKKLRGDYTGTAEPPTDEIGLRLLVSPNEKVCIGQPVIEVRFPIDMRIECPPWLKGATRVTPLAFTRPEVLVSSH
jgi:hypothetical protein